MNINHKSDFAIFVNLDSNNETYPWRVVFRSQLDDMTPPSGEYIAYFDGVNYHSAYRVEGEADYNLVIELTNHALPPGRLVAEWITFLENDLFECGEQRVTTPYIAPIILVQEGSSEVVDPTLMPYVSPQIKGEKGDKGDPGEKGDKGDPGDSVAGDATSIDNDSATIDDDGVYIKPTPLSNNNVLGGLLAVFDINTDGELENEWVHPDLGEYAYLTVTSVSSSAYKVGVVNGIWGYYPDEYNVVGTSCQCAYITNVAGGITVHDKASTEFYVSGFNPYAYSFAGAHIFVYSTRHLWY